MPHQFISVAWMVEQEKSKNFGGILADEMGEISHDYIAIDAESLDRTWKNRFCYWNYDCTTKVCYSLLQLLSSLIIPIILQQGQEGKD